MRVLQSILPVVALLAVLPSCDTAHADISSAASSATTSATTDAIRSSFCKPAVSSVSASSGTEVGGTTVTVNGACFTGTTSVTFGGVAGTSLGSVTATSLSITTPAYASALSSTATDNDVTVAVTGPGGTGSKSAGFRYTPQPKNCLGSKWALELRAYDPRVTLNGSTVSSWPDYAGNGTAVQGTAANQPTFSSSSFNNGPGVTFDGVNDYLDATLTTSVSANNRPYVLVAYARVAGASKFLVALQDTAGSTDALFVAYGTTNHVGYRQKNNAFDALDTGVALDTGRHVMEVGAAINTEPSLRFDGSNKVTSTTHDYVPDSALTHLVMGATLASGSPFSPANGTIAHIVVASDMPTTSELSCLRTFETGANWKGTTYSSNTLGLP